jgi:hypothetical protein
MLRQATGRDRKRVVIYGKEAKQIIVESSSRSSRPSNHLTTRVVEQGTATAGVNRFLHSRVLYMSMKDTSSIPVRYQFDTSPIPLRYQSDTSSIPLRYQFDTSSIPLRYQFDTSSIPVRYQFDTSSIPVRYQFDTTSIPVRYHFDTTRLQV